MWFRRVALWALLSLPLLVGAEEPAASRVISRLNATLLDVLQNADKLGYQGRFDKIAPVVSDAFDVAFMAEKSIGRFWKDLSETDKATWVALFREFTAANYAGNFDKFSGQRFEMRGEEPGQNDTIVVQTILHDPSSEDVELSYRLRQTPSGPKIVDVYLKGTVSELALRRSDYTSVLERDGFQALVTLVRGKIGDLAAGRAKRTGTK